MRAHDKKKLTKLIWKRLVKQGFVPDHTGDWVSPGKITASWNANHLQAGHRVGKD
jgi:hypothetical protein